MAKIGWECGRCGDVHDWEDDAQECCQPEVKEVYLCAECEEVHKTELEADNCCLPEDDDSLPMASPKELEVAGQQRLPI
jgi:hypothetical protein